MVFLVAIDLVGGCEAIRYIDGGVPSLVFFAMSRIWPIPREP